MIIEIVIMIMIIIKETIRITTMIIITKCQLNAYYNIYSDYTNNDNYNI